MSLKKIRLENFNKKHSSYSYKKPYKNKTKYKKILFSLVSLFIILILIFAIIKPLPIVEADTSFIKISAQQPKSMPWPPNTNSAVGAQYFGTLLSNNDEKPVPTASTAKIFTALVIDSIDPQLRESDTYVITEKDVEIYNNYLAINGSVLPVSVGQVITAKQAYQAILIISANNIADTMAIWAFGSLDEYTNYANSKLKEWGLLNTNIADASGFSSDTKSTASDLVKATEKLLDIPVFAEIVSSEKFDIPNIGPMQNTNRALGVDGVVGVKTGNTDEAGGCFVLAQKVEIGGEQTVTMLVAVMGQFNVFTAVQESLKLSKMASEGFAYKTIISSNQTISQYKPTWGGGPYNVSTRNDVNAVVWQWQETTIPVELNKIKYSNNIDNQVGSISINSNGQSIVSPLYLEKPIQKPSYWWRVFNTI